MRLLPHGENTNPCLKTDQSYISDLSFNHQTHFSSPYTQSSSEQINRHPLIKHTRVPTACWVPTLAGTRETAKPLPLRTTQNREQHSETAENKRNSNYKRKCPSLTTVLRRSQRNGEKHEGHPYREVGWVKRLTSDTGGW